MSFQQGLSGLNAVSKSLEVIGNNIANANTIGAKAARAEFSSVYAASLNGTGGGSGIGVSIGAVAQQFTQGQFTATENSMDVAINGRGFFMFRDAASGKEVYGRNGQFKLERNGFVTNNAGMHLLAKSWDARVDRAEGEPVPMVLPQGGGSAIKTGEGPVVAQRGIHMALNLDAEADVITAAVPRIDFTDSRTFNFSTQQTLFDGQGAPLTMTYYYQKTGSNEWSVYASIDGPEGPVPLDQTNGTAYDPTTDDPDPVIELTFDGAGKLASTSAVDAELTINDPREPPLETVLFTDLPLKIGDATQFAADFAITELKQDGFAFGKLTGVTFDADGVVKATYSNGRNVNLYQLQLADFANVQGLKPMGGNVWEATFESGEKTINPPGVGGSAVLMSGMLEESTIDLTAELVNMITAQRMYQANAQTIKTMDDVMQTLVNLR
jgi:flagellar hook protein FlgE